MYQIPSGRGLILSTQGAEVHSLDNWNERPEVNVVIPSLICAIFFFFLSLIVFFSVYTQIATVRWELEPRKRLWNSNCFLREIPEKMENNEKVQMMISGRRTFCEWNIGGFLVTFVGWALSFQRSLNGQLNGILAHNFLSENLTLDTQVRKYVLFMYIHTNVYMHINHMRICINTYSAHAHKCKMYIQ